MPVAMDTVEIEMTIHNETAQAILASDTGEIEKAIWLPRSMVDIEPTSKATIYLVTMPRWKAEQEDLI